MILISSQTMLLRVGSIKNKLLKRFLEHIVYLTMIIVLIPCFVYFELCIVAPALFKQWSITYFIHLFCGSFLLLNIVGNLVYGMFTDTSIKRQFLNGINKTNWTLCSICECLRPPRAWHCNTCDICILKRDHHCAFLACCIGYFNYRYFMYFLFYLFVSSIYAFYYNVQFLVLSIRWNHGLVILKFISPLLCIVIDFSHESFYVSLVVVYFLVGILSGLMFFYQLNNILKGRTSPETRYGTKSLLYYNKGWKTNLIEVFGSKWYLTWILPFLYSPLPGDGMEWIVEDKYQ